MKPRYRRMLEGMADKPEPGAQDWSVYVLHCADGTFYTGIAKDAQARLKKHNSGKGAVYTRTRGPTKLLYVKDGMTRSQALIREAQIKKLPRPKKESLISSHGKSSG